MALRFNKRIKIAPGVKLNLGLGGVSTTVGARGASINVGKKGAHANIGIPGTGLSSRTKISGGSAAQKQATRQTKAPPLKASEKFFMFIGILAIIGFLIWLF